MSPSTSSTSISANGVVRMLKALSSSSKGTQPRFQFVVLNRRNTDNLVENLLGDFEFEVQVPYLLYQNASQEVNGIWFYNAHECEEVDNLFSGYCCFTGFTTVVV